MRLLFLGDVVGRPGRSVVTRLLPGLRNAWQLDCVVVNGENAAHGFGITESIYESLLAAGADVITLGNHSFDQREALVFIDRQPRLLRPANYPEGTPGRGVTIIEAKNGARVLVVNVMGRLFMDALDDPFAVMAHTIGECPLREGCDAILVDMHAEATSEKQALAHFLDGRVSVVVGTHTHVPTADVRLLPGGTAFQSDAGMCGDYQSVLGMQPDESIRRFVEKTPGSRLEVATGEGTLSGLAVEIDDATGLAVKVAAVRLGPHLAEARPAFWEEAAG
jgi:metallophosphoesterase (TIGR00282 family)